MTVVIVQLEGWEYEWASHVGIRRCIENWDVADAPHYDRKRMEDDRTAQVAACVCELAVAKFLNEYWGGHVWPRNKHAENKNRADVGRNIEVRRVRTSNNGAVRKHQLNKDLVLFIARAIDPEFTAVELIGWIDHDEAWEKGEPSGYSANTRIIKQQFLNHPADYGEERSNT